LGIAQKRVAHRIQHAPQLCQTQQVYLGRSGRVQRARRPIDHPIGHRIKRAAGKLTHHMPLTADFFFCVAHRLLPVQRVPSIRDHYDAGSWGLMR